MPALSDEQFQRQSRDALLQAAACVPGRVCCGALALTAAAFVAAGVWEVVAGLVGWSDTNWLFAACCFALSGGAERVAWILGRTAATGKTEALEREMTKEEAFPAARSVSGVPGSRLPDGRGSTP